MNVPGRLFGCVARGVPRFSTRFYKAASLSARGGPLEIVNVEEVKPRDDEVLVEVSKAGFNCVDINMIQGRYHLKPNTPFVPGVELAGTVKAVGSAVSAVKEGDRVVALRSQATGALAQQCILSPSDFIMQIPPSMTFETAVCLPVDYATAYIALKKMASERHGSSVLILADKGGMGLSAVDLAQNVFEAQVFAASDTDAKLERLRKSGVYLTLDWRKGSMGDELKKVTFDKGVDMIIDTVGGKPLQDAFAGLKVGGHVISCGFSSGQIPSVSLLDLHRLQASIAGVWVGEWARSELEEVMTYVIGLCNEGFLNVHLDGKYHLEKINECIKDVEEGRVFGKAIIDVK